MRERKLHVLVGLTAKEKQSFELQSETREEKIDIVIILIIVSASVGIRVCIRCYESAAPAAFPDFASLVGSLLLFFYMYKYMCTLLFSCFQEKDTATKYEFWIYFFVIIFRLLQLNC